jgi:uncharacterized protein involved in oxidation of intracellular sulfur
VLKLGIVVLSNDPETVWNAFRFGNYARLEGDEVRVFLLGKGVEAESLDSPEFQITKKMQALTEKGGSIVACGTCLKLRQAEGSALCPVATLQEMHDIVAASDKVLTF